MELNRRDFFKLSAATGAAAGLGAFGFDLRPAYAQAQGLKIERAAEIRTVCPYCAVGCSMIAYVTGYGDTTSLNTDRIPRPMYRAPGADEWQEISWGDALDRLARLMKTARDERFVTTDET